jgi:hypothetical protein
MRPFIAVLIALLGGCTHLQVQDMGNGQHSLSATAPSGGFDGSREAAIQDANDFCNRSGQQAVIDGFFDKSALGPLGEHTSSIIFRCGPPHTLHF